jgi:hypothetical protein
MNKIDLIIDALSVARNSVWSALNQEALAYAIELKLELAKPEQEPVAWRNAAIRLGEDLYSVGPNGYYEMTAKQWLDWVLSVVNTAPPRTEWVGLSINEGRDFFESKLTRAELIAEINEFLEEKNK